MKGIRIYLLAAGALLTALLSYPLELQIGMRLGEHLKDFSLQMLLIFPPAMVLIGLFEVWVERERIEKHLGEGSGNKGYFWAVVLAVTTLAPFMVSIPVGHSLYNKGARLSVVLVYLGAACVCRIPMTLFEASYLGLKFTIIRWSVSLVLIILTSAWMGGLIERFGLVEKKSE